MSSSETAISIRNLSKSYTIAHDQEKHSTLAETILSRMKNPLKKSRKETFWALQDVSFDVKRGEVVGILGRNGAGKSTLLKILSRITEPTNGQIELWGRVGSLLEVGTGFHAELTGRENVFLNGAILGMSKAEIRRQFDAIVDFAGVERFLDTPVKRYSSGMYVRLAFAVAAHLNPEILIVDEVLAVGDADFQKKCLGKMQDVSAHGRTVLFVSHNIGMLKSLCTTAVLLNGGQLIQQGPAKQVIDSYSAGPTDGTRHHLNVADAPRAAGHGERLRIIQIVLNKGRPIFHGDPLEIAIVYDALRPITQLALGIGIGKSDGSRLLTIESDQPGPRYDVPVGRGVMSVVLENFWLEPGLFSLAVGARTGELNAVDAIGNGGYIEILPSDHTIGTAHTGAFGGFRPPTVWTTPHNAIEMMEAIS